jgi:hypothetical protein
MTTPLPKGKLDAMTTPTAVTAADGGGVVNGPEGEILDWDAGWEPIHCRRARRSIGCWSAMVWSARSRVSVAGSITGGGNAPGRCSCGNWTSWARS